MLHMKDMKTRLLRYLWMLMLEGNKQSLVEEGRLGLGNGASKS